LPAVNDNQGNEVIDEDFDMLTPDQKRLLEVVEPLGRPFTTPEALKAWRKKYGSRREMSESSLRRLLKELLGLRIDQTEGEGARSRKWLVVGADGDAAPSQGGPAPDTEKAALDAILAAAGDYAAIDATFREQQIREGAAACRRAAGLKPIAVKLFDGAWALAQREGRIVYAAGAGGSKALHEFRLIDRAA
jgi:hypothetical protein